MKLSYFLIPKIGLKNMVWLYIGLNAFTIFVKRESYLQWLETKTSEDFKIDMGDKKTQESEKKNK